MAYNKKIQVKKQKADAVLPDNIEWEAYKKTMMDEGKIIKWDMSAFDDDGIATIDIITDSEDTWNDIRLKSLNIRKKGDFKIVSAV